MHSLKTVKCRQAEKLGQAAHRALIFRNPVKTMGSDQQETQKLL